MALFCEHLMEVHTRCLTPPQMAAVFQRKISHPITTDSRVGDIRVRCGGNRGCRQPADGLRAAAGHREHAPESQRLLDGLSAAHMCLLDSKKEEGSYDATLKVSLLGYSSTSSHKPKASHGCWRRNRVRCSGSPQAYNDHDYEKVLNLLKVRLASDDPGPQLLSEGARSSLDQIQHCPRTSNVWKQKDAKRLTQVADQLLRLQPSRLQANEAIHWASANRSFWSR